MCSPWLEAPYSDAAETNQVGGLTLDGFLSLVRIFEHIHERFCFHELVSMICAHIRSWIEWMIIAVSSCVVEENCTVLEGQCVLLRELRYIGLTV